MDRLTAFFLDRIDDGARLHAPDPTPRRRTIFAHAALSSFGFVPGGERAVLRALVRACRKRDITLVMPAFRDEGSERECRAMGRVAEAFRRLSFTRHSAHPVLSLSARGPLARSLLTPHAPASGLGWNSPLGALYRLDALVLMLGTGYEACTALHLVEYAEADRARAAGREVDTVTCWANGETWRDIAFRVGRFPAWGEAFERIRPQSVVSGELPAGRYRLFRVRDIVDAILSG